MQSTLIIKTSLHLAQCFALLSTHVPLTYCFVILGCALFSQPTWAQPRSDRAQRAETGDIPILEIGQREVPPPVERIPTHEK